ncbi:hypothetical protein SEA_MABODAMACA_62 [Microbacterium phage Mabodamaca]|uniref:Uncharacterized protein n=1 Tax=Microbacterium phage Mabodamaca TaxID=3078574 RepID=A0AA96NE17_9CAUD|nr:hypothetical protein SEA_MABODAMACA_62 [Microbacterium phage Mabodamaca]
MEDRGRELVFTLRTSEPALALTGMDAFVLGPIMARLNAAVADFLEYHLDVSGGVDGIARAYDVLKGHALSLPGAALFQSTPGLTPMAADELRPESAVTGEYLLTETLPIRTLDVA